VSTSPEARLVNLLGTAARGVTDAMDAATLAAAGLDTTACAALIAMLDFSPAGSVRMLSQILGLTHSGTVRLVDRLAAPGYVTRTAGLDARSIAVTLTSSGGALAQRIQAARDDAIRQSLGPLSARQRDSLVEISEQLISRLTEQRLEQRAAGHPPARGALCRECDFTACGRRYGACPAANVAAAARPPG
jgi:MarR family transcriptional repressor of emrRAB